MAKKKTAGCTCARQVNEALEANGDNTRLVIGQYINLKTGKMATPKVVLKVEKADTKNRKPLGGITPTYCPFCGEKYL